ncbi:MAG: zf-HC2 domain-containing protein [candidate division Zixibacteria bacterium]|nr:zf-HC2 domain-containing protein [candidate division Zixibacteria bacterium]
MTCHYSLALLEDYIEGTLTAELTEQVNQHLAGCSGCRDEYAAAQNLRELLRDKPTYQPPPEYWSELSSIVLARTVDSPSTADELPTTIDLKAERRNAFVRSLVSFAASIMILFSAILVGSGRQGQIAAITAPESPLFVLASPEASAENDNYEFVSSDERLLLTRGILLLGPPGGLGRIAAFTELGQLTD